MAIDTAPKRRSAAAVGFFLLGPGVTPDAAKPQFWRQCAAWGYGGILAGAAAVVVSQFVNPMLATVGRMMNR